MLYEVITDKIEKWGHAHFRSLKIYRLEIKIPNQVTDLMLLSIKFLQGAAIILIISVSLLLVFGIFPQTRDGVQDLFRKLVELLESISQLV